MASRKPTAKQILSTALMLAEKSSWEKVRLHKVADVLHVQLRDIHKYYDEKEDLVEA